MHSSIDLFALWRLVQWHRYLIYSAAVEPGWRWSYCWVACSQIHYPSFLPFRWKYYNIHYRKIIDCDQRLWCHLDNPLWFIFIFVFSSFFYSPSKVGQAIVLIAQVQVSGNICSLRLVGWVGDGLMNCGLVCSDEDVWRGEKVGKLKGEALSNIRGLQVALEIRKILNNDFHIFHTA